MGYLIRTVNGKTVYLAKVTDQLFTKVNQLQSALRQINSTFSDWQTQLKLFAKHENCHFNNFMEFLSKFSLEVTRTFLQQLCFTEINDILHQAHKLHNKISLVYRITFVCGYRSTAQTRNNTILTGYCYGIERGIPPLNTTFRRLPIPHGEVSWD